MSKYFSEELIRFYSQNFKLKYNYQIIIEYLYKDLSVQPDIDTLSVSYIDDKNFEPIPLNQEVFDLEESNISLEDGTEPIRSGISFFKDFSNKDDTYFLRELGLLNSTGDFSVDYKNGIISVFGNDGSGIEEDIILASYKYKRNLELDRDFYVDEEFNLFVNYYSIYLGDKITINFEYSNVLVSLLIGAGYDAYCVHGNRFIRSNESE